MRTAAISGAALMTCSKLSSRSSSRRPSTSSGSEPPPPSARAAAGPTSAGSASGASGTHHTPSGYSSVASPAAWSASRVFPDPAGARQREEPRVVAREQLSHVRELVLATEERRRGDGEVRPVERLQGRELVAAELENPLWRAQVLEPVLAEVAQFVPVDERRRRSRDEHLPAVPGGSDARRAVDVSADVALLREQRRAGVEAHPHRIEPAPVRRLARRQARRAQSRTRRRTRRPACPPRRRRIARTPRAKRGGAPRALRILLTPSSCRSRVEPSMSVKRKVTVPVGRSARIARSSARHSPSSIRTRTGSAHPTGVPGRCGTVSGVIREQWPRRAVRRRTRSREPGPIALSSVDQ